MDGDARRVPEQGGERSLPEIKAGMVVWIYIELAIEGSIGSVSHCQNISSNRLFI
jgi:hypothetical protein